MNFLKKNWQWLIPIIITLLAAIPSFYSLFKNKEISLHFGQSSPLVNSYQPNINLIVEGKTLTNPFITEIMIRNVGNEPLNKQDFQDDMEISCDKYNTIISLFIKESSPEFISVTREVKSHKITILPFFLNPAEYFVIQIITDGYKKPNFKHNLRISGFEINQETSDKDIKFDHWISLIVLFILTSLSQLIRYSSTEKNESESYTNKEIAYTIAILIIEFSSILYLIYLFFYIEGFLKFLIPAAHFVPYYILKFTFKWIESKQVVTQEDLSQ